MSRQEQLIATRERIRNRLLELEIIEAQRQVDYYERGIPTKPADKARLALERAGLKADLEPVLTELRAMRKQQVEENRTHYATVLTKLLVDNGLIDLVRQARMMSSNRDLPVIEGLED